MRLTIERIVKVASVFTVNGDQRQVAQVDTLELVLLDHVILQALSFLDDCIGPFAGNVVAAQRDFDFHAWRHVVANHFNHLTLGLTTHGRPLGDAHLGVLAVLDAALGVRRNQHVMLNTGVVSNHKANAVFFVIAPHQNLVGAGYHLDNRTFATATAIYAGDTAENAVAIKYQAHLRGAEEQVFTAVVRHQKAETVTMPLNPSGDQVQFVDWCVGTAPRVDHLTVTLHGAQTSAQSLDTFFVLQPELLLQLGARRRRAPILQQLKDQLATGNGVVILFCFAPRLRVHLTPVRRHSGVGGSVGCGRPGGRTGRFGLFRHRRLLNRKSMPHAPVCRIIFFTSGVYKSATTI